MKNYAKVLVAVQFLGNVNVLKDILDKKDVVKDGKEDFLFKVSGVPTAGYWRLAETDYVTKENGVITVYKKEKFEKDFDEVLIEDVKAKEVYSAGMVPDVSKVQVMDLKAKDVKEIKVKEFIEVKSEKKSADKDKKE